MVISNLDGLYLAIYSYVLISILFICFILSTRNTQHTSQVTDLHATARDKPRRILFSLLIATFLGTPPTLGFFYKMYLFQVFSIFGWISVFIAAALNLVMLVLYLQLLRTNQIEKKNTRNVGLANENITIEYTIILIIIIISFAPIFITLLVDIFLFLI